MSSYDGMDDGLIPARLTVALTPEVPRSKFESAIPSHGKVLGSPHPGIPLFLQVVASSKGTGVAHDDGGLGLTVITLLAWAVVELLSVTVRTTVKVP